MNSNRDNWILFGLFFIFAVFRFFYLEADPPSYNLSGINVTDEPYYCFSGLNEYYSSEEREIEIFDFNVGSFLQLHNKTLVYSTLKLFGNNYYGLRIAAVLLSVGSIFLLFQIISRFIPLSLFEKALVIGVLFSDYYFFLFSRYITPQIFSIFWITVSLYFLSLGLRKNKWFLIPAIIVLFFQVFLVYPYMAFVGGGIGLFFLFRVIRKESIFLPQNLLGALGGVLLILGCLHIDGAGIEEYLDYFKTFNQTRDEFQGLAINNVVTAFLQIIYTNLFRYNPVHFFGILIILMVIVNEKIRESFNQNLIVQLCAAVIIMAFLQSIFIQSYPFKKWVVLFPFSIILFVFFVKHFAKLPILPFLVIMLITTLFYYMNSSVNNSREFWVGFKDSYPIYGDSNHVLFLFLALFILVGILRFTYRQKISGNTLLVGTFLIGMFQIVAYYGTATYTYKKSLRTYNNLGNAILIGDFSHAYCFYNKMIPTFNPYLIKVNYIDSALITSKLDELDEKNVVFIEKNILKKKLNDKVNLYGDDYILISDQRANFGTYQLFTSHTNHRTPKKN